MRYAFFRKCINPRVGTSLGGYERKPTSDGIYDDLYMQLLLLEDDKKRRLLLGAFDIIGIDSSFANKLRRWIKRQDESLDEAAVIFNATHTHCGPATCTFVENAGIISPEYMNFLEASIKQAVSSLLKSKLVPCTLKAGFGSCKLAVNRRLPVKEQSDGREILHYSMQPNFNASIDSQLGLLQVKSIDHEILIVNYACHPTTRAGYIISGDYPSAAVRALKADSYSGRDVMFLQGAAGDLRVPCTNDEKTCFRQGDAVKVIEYGNVIADSVRKILKNGLKKVLPSFSAYKRDFVLPYDKNYVPATAITPEFTKLKNWRLKHEGTEGVKMECIVWKIASNCILMALPGEICHQIGKRSKKLSSVKYPFFLGYTNGCPAYIPTDEIIEQGGYEGKDSMLGYGQPWPFKIGSEKIIYDNLKFCLSQLNNSNHRM